MCIRPRKPLEANCSRGLVFDSYRDGKPGKPIGHLRPKWIYVVEGRASIVGTGSTTMGRVSIPHNIGT